MSRVSYVVFVSSGPVAESCLVSTTRPSLSGTDATVLPRASVTVSNWPASS
ncbi:hypothetical protein [Nonomuraea sp. CA-141351]|uniref:hypothetical protein n=1 Tax=Nonomuraea sp. CA-141351 TaxID=3239996 RepID=UPI003D946411